jgi:hypothetical protein
LYHAGHACDRAITTSRACDRAIHRQCARIHALAAEKEPDKSVASASAANIEEK